MNSYSGFFFLFSLNSSNTLPTRSFLYIHKEGNKECNYFRNVIILANDEK